MLRHVTSRSSNQGTPSGILNLNQSLAVNASRNTVVFVERARWKRGFRHPKSTLRGIMAFTAPAPVLRTRHVVLGAKKNSDNVLCRKRPSRIGVPVRACATAPAPVTVAPTKTASSVELDRVVCKFGGSSLADATRLQEVAKLVRLQQDRTRQPPIVVLSAMGPSTNELLAAANRALNEGVVDLSSIKARAHEACKTLSLNAEELCDPLLINLDQLLLGVKFIKELSPRTLDYLVSFGERLSVRIFAAHLARNEGIPAMHVDAFDAGFLSDSSFTNAELDESTFPAVKKYFSESVPDDVVVVVTGFIAKDAAGDITTLGRGGSDLTAAALGAAIGASEVQVWKDVDGILSTDPRIVSDAVPVPSVSFEEAAEMAFFGAKVLHPSAMHPAMRWDIPVRVKNSYNPSHPGTVIVRERSTGAENPVTAVSLKKNVQIVDVVSTRMLGAYGFLAEVFKAFAARKVSVDTIATSEVSVSMTLDDACCDAESERFLKEELGQIARVDFSENDKAIVSLVSNTARGGEVVGRAVSALNENGIQILMISQGASKINISLVIDGQCAKDAVRIVHKEFFGV